MLCVPSGHRKDEWVEDESWMEYGPPVTANERPGTMVMETPCVHVGRGERSQSLGEAWVEDSDGGMGNRGAGGKQEATYGAGPLSFPVCCGFPVSVACISGSHGFCESGCVPGDGRRCFSQGSPPCANVEKGQLPRKGGIRGAECLQGARRRAAGWPPVGFLRASP